MEYCILYKVLPLIWYKSRNEPKHQTTALQNKHTFQQTQIGVLRLLSVVSYDINHWIAFYIQCHGILSWKLEVSHISTNCLGPAHTFLKKEEKSTYRRELEILVILCIFNFKKEEGLKIYSTINNSELFWQLYAPI